MLSWTGVAWLALALGLGVLLGKAIKLADGLAEQQRRICEPVSTEELEDRPGALLGVVGPPSW